MTFSFDIICHFISQTPRDLSLQTFFHSFSVPRQEDIRNPHSSRSSHRITASQFIQKKIPSPVLPEKGISCYLSLLSVIIQHLLLLQLFLHSLLQHPLLLHPCYLYPCCLFLLQQRLQCLRCHQKELQHRHIFH